MQIGGATMEIQMRACVLTFVAIAFSSLLAISRAAPTDLSTASLIKVDPSGNGDFKKIQDAINAVPKNSSNVVISIKPGIYKEKVTVPADKPFITLSGSDASTTIITGSETDYIFKCATLTVLATDFVARSITIQNTFGQGKRAVALGVSGDRAAFHGCRIIGFQDTLFAASGKQYYDNCYIEGAIDFIFGDAAAVFENCHVNSLSSGTWSITAQHKEKPSENTGFTFLGGKITGPAGKSFLGRPWAPYAKVVFAKTYMSNTVLPQGWDDWGRQAAHNTVYYAEYKCSGPGANTSGRVKWSKTLSDDEAKPFLSMEMIEGKSWVRPAPTNFKKLSEIASTAAAAPAGNSIPTSSVPA